MKRKLVIVMIIVMILSTVNGIQRNIGVQKMLQSFTEQQK